MSAEKTRELILQHFNRYPNLQTQDLFKFLFQSAFGCEHLVSSLERVTHYLESEYTAQKENIYLIEPLDGNYSRVHLGVIDKGLSIKTFAKLFFLSAKIEKDALKNLELKLEIAKELIETKKLPLLTEEFSNLREKWKNSGYMAIHHSDAFRNSYHPCYRLIDNRLVNYIPLLIEIDGFFAQTKALEPNCILTVNFNLNNDLDLCILNKVYDGFSFCLAESDNNCKQTALKITKA